MGDQLAEFGLAETVVERAPEMTDQLLVAAERHQGRDRDQAAVALRQAGAFPDIAVDERPFRPGRSVWARSGGPVRESARAGWASRSPFSVSAKTSKIHHQIKNQCYQVYYILKAHIIVTNPTATGCRIGWKFEGDASASELSRHLPRPGWRVSIPCSAPTSSPRYDVSAIPVLRAAAKAIFFPLHLCGPLVLPPIAQRYQEPMPSLSPRLLALPLRERGS